jgi:4-amino-4-deoxy-L-arabinose transferase-like glycosyltransferase
MVGAVLLGSILFLAIRTLRRAARGALLPYDLVAAVAGLLLLVLLSNLTNARFNVLDFQLLMVLILAVAYTTRYTESGVDRARQPTDPVHADASSPAGCAPR